MNEIEIIGDFIHNILEAWDMFFTVIDEMVSKRFYILFCQELLQEEIIMHSA